VGPARSSFRLDAIVSVAAYETPATGEKHLRASEAGAVHTSARNPRSRQTVSCCTASDASSLPPAGSCARSPPTTDPTPAPANSTTRSSTWTPASASSAPDDPTQMAVSNVPN
jgi:hypothetical protein